MERIVPFNAEEFRRRYVAGTPVIARLEQGASVLVLPGPEPAPAYTQRPREERVYDPVKMSGLSAVGCPRCGGLLYEERSGLDVCCDDQGCGWRTYYPAGTTHRADGSALKEAVDA